MMSQQRRLWVVETYYRPRNIWIIFSIRYDVVFTRSVARSLVQGIVHRGGRARIRKYTPEEK